MTETLWRVEQVHGDEFSFPTTKAKALDQVRERMDREPLGDPLKVVRIDYRLDPDAPPEPYTEAVRKVWRSTVLRFPEVGSLGVYVHKPDSQHCVDGPQGETGNAADWAAPARLTDPKLIAWLWDVFDFHRREGIVYSNSNGRDGLPVSQVIFRDKIATAEFGWIVRPYTGTFHATHEHSSASPLRPECA